LINGLDFDEKMDMYGYVYNYNDTFIIGFCIFFDVVHGSWFMVHGSWFMVH
jgi:hypothetical protein